MDVGDIVDAEQGRQRVDAAARGLQPLDVARARSCGLAQELQRRCRAERQAELEGSPVRVETRDARDLVIFRRRE